ncbi:MAG: hypothetical protein ACM3ZA_01445 [Bacillota bacterium]
MIRVGQMGAGPTALLAVAALLLGVLFWGAPAQAATTEGGNPAATSPAAQAAPPVQPAVAPVQPAPQEVAQPAPPPGVSLDVVTLVLSYAPGTLRAFESFTLLGEGSAAGPLPLPLPEGARQVQVESDLDPTGWVQSSWGLLYRPGVDLQDPVRVSVQFEVPAHGQAGVFSQPLPYAHAGLAVLVDTTTLTAPASLNTALTDQGQVSVANRLMQQFSDDAAPAGQVLRLSLQYVPTGQEAPNVTPIPEPGWLKWLLRAGVPVLLAVAAGLGFLAFRRRRATPAVPATRLPIRLLEQEKERLVEKISDLDQEFGLGQIAADSHSQRRAELKRQLMAVLDQLKGA